LAVFEAVRFWRVSSFLKVVHSDAEYYKPLPLPELGKRRREKRNGGRSRRRRISTSESEEGRALLSV
jgi:hypothetical protein